MQKVRRSEAGSWVAVAAVPVLVGSRPRRRVLGSASACARLGGWGPTARKGGEHAALTRGLADEGRRAARIAPAQVALIS